MTFWWWDDALTVANRRSSLTGIRHRVMRWQGVWVVDEVQSA